MDRIGEIIHQHLYWPNIRNSVCKEVTICDNCQRTKIPNKRYGKFPAKLSEEIPWNKNFVYIIEL